MDQPAPEVPDIDVRQAAARQDHSPQGGFRGMP